MGKYIDFNPSIEQRGFLYPVIGVRLGSTTTSIDFAVQIGTTATVLLDEINKTQLAGLIKEAKKRGVRIMVHD